MIRVLMSGGGKMGSTIVDALEAADGIEPTGVVDGLGRGDAFALSSGATLPLYTDAAAAIEAVEPDVIIDFTNAAWTPLLVDAALERRVRMVIGTTGLSQQFVEKLGQRCGERKLGAVLAANFSLGAVLMMHMAKVAAPFFESAEIIELHHDQKVDAPSGTSIATARGMLEARGGRPFARNVPEATPVEATRAGAVDGITIHSVRLPGFVAHQEVIFGAQGQTLTIRHDSNRESYIPGVLLAVREVMARDSLVIGLDTLIRLG
ncbi:MAG TPA: 4-hydroxy-tetrahydrodipicolinate reductase [Dehalococcoidia bacterium]|nr:4-hydroxy-tetrahydrodipicolinate reductase [Dehalococcoidia bacterium]